MLIFIQWRIYLQWYVANIEVSTQQATGTDWHPTCLESSDRSRSSWWMQFKINFEAFSCRHFSFKNNAQECIRTRHFHSENWKIFRSHPIGASTCAPSALDPCPTIQNPRFATEYAYAVKTVLSPQTWSPSSRTLKNVRRVRVSNNLKS